MLSIIAVIISSAQSDSITNIQVTQRSDGSGYVDVYFTLIGTGSGYNINLEASFDAGSTYTSIPPAYLDSVSGISPGDNKHVIWDGVGSFPGLNTTQAKLKIIAFEEGACPPTITDNDGNVYNTVVNGSQCWMTENLKTTQYSNGLAIDYPGTDISAWTNNTNGAYAWYNNDISWKDSYGALYNWYTVTNSNGLCPAGWHVPDDAEWAMLINTLGGDEMAGGKMKSTRTDPDSHPRWNSPNTGATNESNWSGLPGGGRQNNGSFGWPALGSDGTWWTATVTTGNFPWCPFLSSSMSNILFTNDLSFNSGLSVRCVWDEIVHASRPTVITIEVTEITHNTATSGGNITSNGGASITAQGVVWSTSVNPTLENNEGFTSDEPGSGEFASHLNGLSPETPYYVKGYATNSEGTGYGQQLTFTTLFEPEVPTVATAAVTEITYNTATSGGNVTDNGGSNVTARGVVWSTFVNPTIENNNGFTSDGAGLGTFVSYLNGLSPETPYFVRAYATSSAGTAYGNQQQFTTAFGCGISTVTDIDGNIYNTVLIGNQCWIAENLEVTKYNNGMSIDYPGEDVEAWDNNTTGAYAWYVNDISWKDSYGALYNWHAVNNASGLCPAGWHVPTDAEYTTLTNYLGGETIAGGKMKSTRTDPTPHPRWNSPNTGATNESNWSGFPGGYRSGAYFEDFGGSGWWWTSTPIYSGAWGRTLFYNGIYVYLNSDNWSGLGYSVRCLKNE